MNGACSRHGGEERLYRVLGGGGNLRERDHLGDPGVDGRVMLRWIFRKCDMELWTGSSWFRWRGVVNEVLNLRVP